MALVQPQVSPQAASEADFMPQYKLGYVWAISLIAAMGGLLFGYDWVVIGGAKPFFEPYFHILTGTAQSGWANSCALLGCLIGSMISGALSDRFGRKRLLLASGLLFTGSSILTGGASTFHIFVFWRICGGVAIGMASNLSPMYIAEVAPAAMRGRLVAVNQLAIVFGILAAQVSNLLIARKMPDNATAEMIRLSWNGLQGWRWMFYAVAVPSVAFFALTLFVPESPRWLVKKGRDSLALRILARIGGERYAAGEVGQIRATLVGVESQRVRFGELLAPRVRRIIGIGVILAVLQQWCGLNVIFNYGQEIFHDAGYGVSATLFNIVITGAVTFVFSGVAILMVEGLGRRLLILSGCLGLVVTHSLTGLSLFLHMKGLFVVVPVMASMASYALSLAPITWVLISEIFPNRIRGAAISVSVSALWIACFILTYTFPLLYKTLGSASTFWVYAAICLAGAVFIMLRVPETRGKTLEQIEHELVG